MATVNRFFQDPGQSFFLFGPRGTGKSTWLRKHFPKAYYIDLLAPEAFRNFSARPERLQEICAARHSGDTIVIDEIQKLPELLGVVHQIIEERKELRFILTGSSARKLKNAGVDLLAGRALVRAMHPFMGAELGALFSLSEALATGLVPLVFDSSNKKDRLAAYTGLYIKEEVQLEGLVRNIGSFNRFLESVSFSHGCVLNLSDVARDCQVKRKTVEGYISILEDLMLAFKVNIFSKRAKRHLSAHPKFFYFDAGVFRAIRPTGPLDSASEIDGAALEGLVAQHLRAWINYRGDSGDLYFWRTKSGVEVDFVVYGQDIFCAFEVKNSKKVNSKMLKGLISFNDDYPEAKAYLLYRGKDVMVVKNILCIPCETFLHYLDPTRSMDEVFERAKI